MAERLCPTAQRPATKIATVPRVISVPSTVTPRYKLTSAVGRTTILAMNIQQATKQFEAWMAGHIRLLKRDLAVKHTLMARDAFSFLRATFYRWIQLFPALCPGSARAPRVLAVGDLHVENFGTWRDAEGRLVWGINDFDEAYPLPYTNDLVRLATSALLAMQIGHLSLTPAKSCAAILKGYVKGLRDGGRPFVLSEKNRWLRLAVTGRLRAPTGFWERIAALPTVARVPTNVKRLLEQSMPERGMPFRVAHRRAGLGSLGRERFTAIGEWNGGKIAREAKALLPSACAWAGESPDAEIYYSEMLRRAVRAPDPFLVGHDHWVVRRLSPYCSRIELHLLPRGQDEARLLRAMGRELANVHLGTPRSAAVVRADVARRKPQWLRETAETMLGATLKDWKEWRKRNG